MVVAALMCSSFLPSLWDTDQKLCPNAWESSESGKNLLLIPILFVSKIPVCNEQPEYWLFYLSNDIEEWKK